MSKRIVRIKLDEATLFNKQIEFVKDYPLVQYQPDTSRLFVHPISSDIPTIAIIRSELPIGEIYVSVIAENFHASSGDILYGIGVYEDHRIDAIVDECLCTNIVRTSAPQVLSFQYTVKASGCHSIVFFTQLPIHSTAEWAWATFSNVLISRESLDVNYADQLGSTLSKYRGSEPSEPLNQFTRLEAVAMGCAKDLYGVWRLNAFDLGLLQRMASDDSILMQRLHMKTSDENMKRTIAETLNRRYPLLPTLNLGDL